MVQFIRPWEVVNGMMSARERGHGCVRQYLEGVGVARSTAYRWEAETRWLVEFGGPELRRLRREHEELLAQVAARSAAEPAGWLLDPGRELAFVLQAAVQGATDEEIAVLLVRAGGRCLSHETIRDLIAKAAAVARRVFLRYFFDAGRLGAADEIFLGRRPLLLVVEPRSLLVTGLRLASGRAASDWEPLLGLMEALERCASDAGRGLRRALKDAELADQLDMFHGLYKGRASLARAAKSCEKQLDKAETARQALEELRPSGNHSRIGAAQRAYNRAREAADRALAEWCRLADLFGEVERAFDYTTPEGQLNTAERASRLVAQALGAMEESEEGRRLAKTLRVLEREPAFAFLGTLEVGLRALRLEQVGPDRPTKLARLVEETLAWRRTDKDPVSELAKASTGSLADRIEIEVVEVVDFAVRSSSAVECVNSRVRLVQVARKRLSEDFVYLLAVYHNMRTFGRGSARQGKTAAQLAGIELPTEDWIELLDLTAARPPQVSTSASSAQDSAKAA